MNQSAKNALEHYLKEIKRELCAAPCAVREDAVRDATEFLTNEVSLPDFKQLATSEQQIYDHFIESYGSPSQVASEYLQAQATTPQKVNSSGRWSLLAAAVIALTSTAWIVHHWKIQAAPKLSPFTQVDFQGDKIFVEFGGKNYEWLGIDGIPVSKVTASSKIYYLVHWRKRMAEDLVEVLWGMGHSPKETVKLLLRDPQTDTETTIATAPMTCANRYSVYGNWSSR